MKWRLRVLHTLTQFTWGSTGSFPSVNVSTSLCPSRRRTELNRRLGNYAIGMQMGRSLGRWVYARTSIYPYNNHIIGHKANQLYALCAMRFASCSDKVTERTQTTRHVGISCASSTLFTFSPGSIPALWIALLILSGSSSSSHYKKNQNTNFDCITWHNSQRTTVGGAPKICRGVKSFVTFREGEEGVRV